MSETMVGMSEEEIERLSENARAVREEFNKVDQEIAQARIQLEEFGIKTNQVVYAEMKARRSRLFDELRAAEKELFAEKRAASKRRREEHLARMTAQREASQVVKEERRKKQLENEARIRERKEREAKERADRIQAHKELSRRKLAERHISRYFMDVAYEKLPRDEADRFKEIALQRKAADLDFLEAETGECPHDWSSDRGSSKLRCKRCGLEEDPTDQAVS